MPGTAISFMCAALQTPKLQGIGAHEKTLLYRFADRADNAIIAYWELTS